MLSAEEAFERSKEKLEETVQSIDELLAIDGKIKEAVEKGWFATYSEPMAINVGEKLSMDLEEYGFVSTVQSAGMVDAEKKPLVVVTVNWKYKPANTRIKQPESI